MTPATNPPAPAAVGSAGRPLRVLFADDMRELRDLITIVLSRDGHHVDTAPDGAAAWQKISANPDAYDLLITDHHMPMMNGLDLVGEVRRSKFGGKVMVFSSELSPTVHAAYRSLGVDQIMLKPVFPHALRGALRDLFAESKA